MSKSSGHCDLLIIFFSSVLQSCFLCEIIKPRLCDCDIANNYCCPIFCMSFWFLRKLGIGKKYKKNRKNPLFNLNNKMDQINAITPRMSRKSGLLLTFKRAERYRLSLFCIINFNYCSLDMIS